MHKAIFILLLSIASVQAGLSKLEAISMIESGNNDLAVGSAGEVSRYQIKPKVWHVFSDSTTYHNKEISGRVAGKYLSFLENAFQKQAGRSPTDFDLYVLWNAGLSYYQRVGFSRDRVHPVIRERADRYVNLRKLGVATPGGRKLPHGSPNRPASTNTVSVITNNHEPNSPPAQDTLSPKPPE